MARRRMLSKEVFYQSTFKDLSDSAIAFYAYLVLNADDDGFVLDPKGIKRDVRCRKHAWEQLEKAGYVIFFDSGVALIRHWHMMNKVERNYTETTCLEEKAQLEIVNNVYEFKQSVNQVSDIEEGSNAEKSQADTQAQTSSEQIANNLNPEDNEFEGNQYFENLWKMYPKKTDKRNAYLAYQKLIASGVSHEIVKERVRHYAFKVNHHYIDEKAVMDASDYFKQTGCWEDDGFIH